MRSITRSLATENAEISDARVFDSLVTEIPVDTRLPPNYRLTGIRESRQERALFYSIPSNRGRKPSQKSIVESEFVTAYCHLRSGGDLTKTWFCEHLPITASQSTSCSFKVLGELCVLLGVAERARSGRGLKYIGRNTTLSERRG